MVTIEANVDRTYRKMNQRITGYPVRVLVNRILFPAIIQIFQLVWRYNHG